MRSFVRLTMLVAMVLAVAPISGCVYMNVKIPLDTNFESTELGKKVGTSEARSILGLVAWGDASTQAAAKDGGIEVIEHADAEHMAVLGFVYARYRTIVYGD